MFVATFLILMSSSMSTPLIPSAEHDGDRDYYGPDHPWCPRPVRDLDAFAVMDVFCQRITTVINVNDYMTALSRARVSSLEMRSSLFAGILLCGWLIQLYKHRLL